MSSTNFRPSDPHRASLPAVANLASLSQQFSPLFQTRIFLTPNVPSRHIPSLSTPAAVSGSTTLLSNSYTVSSLDGNLMAFESILEMDPLNTMENCSRKSCRFFKHSNKNEDEYMISDNDLLITPAITIPKDMSQLSCGAYMAGIVEEASDGLGFPSRVTSHSAPSPQFPKQTTLLIKFEKACIDRENSFST
ncbi:hypothetical protein KEM48_010461 [Puccinia striiformis f. sp. tritici PST-130]|nr:hypothetical protein KEM48_010461 [Puccinia striiformis f. sp. tritici PST-130]